MSKLAREPDGPNAVSQQPTSSPTTKGKKKTKTSCRPKSPSSNKVKKVQRRIKRLLHGSSRKKSSQRSSTAVSSKVKRLKRAKKLRPLAKA
ncbi:uncharacterized protein LOC123521068 [Echinops telfairi]|uniref:Uncharacterized protein LOC123521068 n=1 Tax=Echinops telfairi TaxID=9371 RepID=A0AC55CM42_ECHTE|nr:uncharacterized protein LOC123521068 [Echinops telfairi]